MDWRYLLWLLDGFHGRIGRKTFWIAMLAVGAANMAACYAASQIQGDQLNAIVDLVFTYPEFAIATKRANDRNLPFWLLGVFFAASVMLDLFSVLGWAGSDAKPEHAGLRPRCAVYRLRHRAIGRTWFPQRYRGSQPAWSRSARGRRPRELECLL